MITFKKIRWKNLLSTGNAFTEIGLNYYNHNLIIGENGAGKSTILDALLFVLYGKPFRKVNKAQLLNTINKKDLVVECEFSVNNKNYLIRRGIKPNILEVYCNEQLVNLDASVHDYQEMIDKHILKVNQKSFSQIVVLGSASFVPFMQLTAANRREIIEDLLDIQIFTTMNTILKEKIAANKTSSIENDMNVRSTEEKIDIQMQHIAELKVNRDDQVKQKKDKIREISAIIKKVDKTLGVKLKELKEYDSLDDNIKKLNKRQSKIVDIQKQLSQKYATNNKEISFFHSNENCPVCRQGIDHIFKQTVISEKTLSNEEVIKALDQLNEEQTKVADMISELSTKMAEKEEINNQIMDLRQTLRIQEQLQLSIEKEITQIASANKAIDVNTGRLEELKNNLHNYQEVRKTLSKEKSTLEIASLLLKDSGIKTKIIRQYIPVINKLINKYLASMDFFVNFELNENFEETIKSRYRDDFSYESFSEGEKARLDLALLFTWRSISKLRNSVNTNLLILDEVFDGSLDSQGSEELIKILQTLTEGNNVFVISHKTDAYLDKFPKVFKFEKHKNFSRVVEL